MSCTIEDRAAAVPFDAADGLLTARLVDVRHDDRRAVAGETRGDRSAAALAAAAGDDHYSSLVRHWEFRIRRHGRTSDRLAVRTPDDVSSPRSAVHAPCASTLDITRVAHETNFLSS